MSTVPSTRFTHLRTRDHGALTLAVLEVGAEAWAVGASFNSPSGPPFRRKRGRDIARGRLEKFLKILEKKNWSVADTPWFPGTTLWEGRDPLLPENLLYVLDLLETRPYLQDGKQVPGPRWFLFFKTVLKLAILKGRLDRHESRLGKPEEEEVIDAGA